MCELEGYMDHEHREHGPKARYSEDSRKQGRTLSGAGPRCCEIESPGKIMRDVEVDAPALFAEGGMSSPACMPHCLPVYSTEMQHLYMTCLHFMNFECVSVLMLPGTAELPSSGHIEVERLDCS